MGLDIWDFMASPSQAVERERSVKRQRKHQQRRDPDPDPDTSVPWFVSLVFFAGLASSIVSGALLIGLALGVGDPMPAWFNGLLIAEIVAMIAALVFILNGFGWARLAWLVLAVAQLWFDQTLFTRWFLLANLVLLVILMIKPASRYFANCAAARIRDK